MLIRVSPSYTPVQGRLHTCYAPVRHSRIILLQYLPFDLHVLSLPLAFILSQDQTLHCNNLTADFAINRCRVLTRFTPSQAPTTNNCLPWLRFILNILSKTHVSEIPYFRNSTSLWIRGPLSILPIHSKNVLSARRLIIVVFQPMIRVILPITGPFFHFGSAKVTEGIFLCNPERKVFDLNSTTNPIQKGVKSNRRKEHSKAPEEHFYPHFKLLRKCG